MDRGEELKKWFTKMGYKGRFPTDLTPIYNASTAPLWQEVMQTVKPREEVARMRNEVLIDHFKKARSDEENLNSKLKHVQVWAKRKDLQKKIDHVRQQILDTEKKVANLERENKMKHLTMENVRKSIDQHRRFIFLLNEKSKQLEAQFYDLNDKLESVTKDNVNVTKEMVKECTEKIVAKIDSCTHEDGYSALIDSTQDLVPVIDKFGNSTEMIWNELVADTEIKKNELKNLITETVDEQSCEVDELSLAKLYAVHVNHTIKTKEREFKTEKLKKELEILRDNVFDNVSNNYSNSSTDIQNVIKLKQRELGLHAGLELLRERIKSMQAEEKVETIEIEMELEQLDACKMRVFDNVNRKCDLIQLLHSDMILMCGENKLKVAKLTNFTAKLDWIDSLNGNLILDEIRTIVKYPFENHFRNLGDYVTDDRLDANSMVILSNLLENTWSPPETILVGLVNAQQKLNVLKSLQTSHVFNRGLDTKVCYRERSSAQVVDKIMMLIMSCRDIEKKLKMVRVCVHLWLNMKFKGFVSPTRLVDNHDYKFYKELYNKFYQHIS